jgi:hypothetical protein
MATTTAIDMANQGGMKPKKFRDALRKEHFAWHEHTRDTSTFLQRRAGPCQNPETPV